MSRPVTALTAPSDEADLRIRLEGGYERLLQARARYDEASAALEHGQWRTRLTEHAGLLSQIAASDAAVAEDLGRAQKLSPELQLIKDLTAARARLESAVGLRSGAAAGGGMSFSAQLLRLEKRAHAELPRPLEEGEQVIMSGGFRTDWWKASVAYFLISALPLAALGWVAGVFFGGAGIAATCALGVSVVLAPRLFAGRAASYLLTTRRLIWGPHGRDPKEVRLSDLPAAAVRAGDLLGTLHVRGTRVKLRNIARARELAVRLDLERWLQRQKGVVGPREVGTAALRWLYVTPRQHTSDGAGDGGRSPPSGKLVLRSGFAVRILDQEARNVWHALSGEWPWKPLPLEPILESLRRLPPGTVDALLLSLTAAGAVVFRPEDSALSSRNLRRLAGVRLSNNGKDEAWFGRLSHEEMRQFQAYFAKWRVEPGGD